MKEALSSLLEQLSLIRLFLSNLNGYYCVKKLLCRHPTACSQSML